MTNFETENVKIEKKLKNSIGDPKIKGRSWIDLIRGQKITLASDVSIGWKIPDEDNSTTGAERLLPTFIGSICTMPEAAIDPDFAKKPENGEFLRFLEKCGR